MRKQGKGTGRNSSRRIKRLAWAAIVVTVFALGAMAAVSLRTSRAKDPAARQNNSQAVGNSRSNPSLRVGAQIPLDPQTGQVRPLTQEEAQELAAGIKQLVNQSTDGLQSVRHADGSVSIDLQGRFQSIAVAKRDEDGKVIQSCVDNRQAAAAFFGIDPQLVGVPATAASSKPGAAGSERGANR
jgi:hypothetical protein